MSHAVSNATIYFEQVCRHQIQCRIGAGMRRPEERAPERELPATHTFHVQIAAPPPQRVGGAAWPTGLVLHGPGQATPTPFDPAKSGWEAAGVYYPPNGEFDALDTPTQADVVLTKDIRLPRVQSGRPPVECTLIDPLSPAVQGAVADDEVPHFISIPYSTAKFFGAPLTTVAVSYFWTGTLEFVAEARGEWLAISTEHFKPGRISADYLVPVGSCPDEQSHAAAMRERTAEAAT